MKRHSLLACLSIGLLGLTACNETSTNKTASTDSSTSSKPAMVATPPVDSAAQIKAWVDAMTPGEQHKMLARAVGKWKTETTMWMASGAPPETSSGTADVTMSLGGRFQKAHFSSLMMGQPFEGESVTAYDNVKKKFVYTWMDNMGTGIIMMEGPWDEASKSMTLIGTFPEPMTGKETTMREVYKIVDDKHHEVTIYNTADGKEMKNVEIKMTKL